MKSVFTAAVVAALLPASLGYDPVSVSQLQSIMPDANRQTLENDAPYLNDAMQQYNIDTPDRQAAFLGQIAEETGQLNHMTEIGNADGTTYQGRGALQLTGHSNYEHASQALGVNFVNNPSLVADPQYAFQTAGWYWNADNLNKYADAGNINAITKDINGCVDCPVTHNAQRVAYTQTAQNVLNQARTSSPSTSSAPSSSSSSDSKSSKSKDDSSDSDDSKDHDKNNKSDSSDSDDSKDHDKNNKSDSSDSDDSKGRDKDVQSSDSSDSDDSKGRDKDAQSSDSSDSDSRGNGGRDNGEEDFFVAQPQPQPQPESQTFLTF